MIAQPAVAQTADTSSVDRLIERQKAYFRVREKDGECSSTATGETIVVCGHRPANTEPSLPDLPPLVVEAKPVTFKAPERGVGVGGGVTVAVCFLQKCPKKLHFIDLKSIPEAPPGSDADKIAHGLMRDR